MPAKEKQTNRLIREHSPYLLQHAYNPVDWYPWGDEAFEKARREDKPVFLSIGYSTCHWCHVMERESFEDELVAQALNRGFVSIKADREERPDVDAFYMDACVALNGSGGWPLSCFLTHDRKPFFAGTYFPKRDGIYGVGFLTILQRIEDAWKTDRRNLMDYADSMALRPDLQKPSGMLRAEDIQAAFRQLSSLFDTTYGGFGTAPKFPSLHHLMFLMRYGTEYGSQAALDMARQTLDDMYRGGIYDHIGGGFARYSTDRRWLVPHFEKMMTDNAMHIMVYSEAAALFGGDYARIAREVTRFCTRDMRDPGGGFYTALDADSEGEEGKFYTFTPEEAEHVLGRQDGQRYCALYHITRQGNFEGVNIPNLLPDGLPEDSRDFAERCNTRMLQYRSGRVPPFRDDKVMAQVNGLMITALSVHGRILGDRQAVEAAELCARFVLSNLYQDGRLLSRWRNGVAGIPSSSDDYACLVWGLVELYQATLHPDWLSRADQLTREMNRLFWDAREGGYYLAGSDALDLPVRQKNMQDLALPSGNSVMALNLLRLARLTANTEYEEQANQIFRLSASPGSPMGITGLLCALLYAKNGGTEIILTSGNGFEDLKHALPPFLPFATVAACGKEFEGIETIAPYLKHYPSVDGNAAAYVCTGGSCQSPVTTPRQLSTLLGFPQK